jgi:hypothetical protein
VTAAPLLFAGAVHDRRTEVAPDGSTVAASGAVGAPTATAVDRLPAPVPDRFEAATTNDTCVLDARPGRTNDVDVAGTIRIAWTTPPTVGVTR